MAEEINLPGIGKTKKTYVYAGVAVVGVLAFMWYRNRQNQNAASTSTAAMLTDPDGNQCAAFDPQTGFCPGTPGDTNALAQLQGSAAYGSGFGGGSGGGSGCYDQYGNPIACGSSGSTSGPPFTSNAAWASWCESSMGSTGSDAIAAALGHYLTGQPVSDAEVTIIDQAIAVGGYPPVSGPNNMPPSFNRSGNPGGTSVPNVVGQNWLGAIHQLEAAGFKPSPSSKPAGSKDPITKQSPAAGTSAQKGATVTLTGSK